MRKTLIAAAAGCSIALAAPAAHAGRWHHWHHHHGGWNNGAVTLGDLALGLGVVGTVLAQRYPAPAYVPAPAYYPPPTVIYRPPPVFYAPRPWYWRGY